MLVMKTNPNKVFTTCRLVGGSPRGGVTIFRTNRPLRGEGYPVSKGGMGSYVRYGAYTVVGNFNNTNTFSSKGCGVAGRFNKALCRRVNGSATARLVRCMSGLGLVRNNRKAGLCSAAGDRVHGLYLRGNLRLLSTSIHRLKASVGCIILRGLCRGVGSRISFCFSTSISGMRGARSNCTIFMKSRHCRKACYVVSTKQDKDG